MIKLKDILHEQKGTTGNLNYTTYTQLQLLDINSGTFKSTLNMIQQKILEVLNNANSGNYGPRKGITSPPPRPWPTKVALTVTAKETTMPESIASTSQTANVPALLWSLQCNGKPAVSLNKDDTSLQNMGKSRIYGRGISDNDIAAVQDAGGKGGNKNNIQSGMNIVDEEVGSGQFDKYMMYKARRAAFFLKNLRTRNLVEIICGAYPGNDKGDISKHWAALNYAMMDINKDLVQSVDDTMASSYQKQVNKFKAVNAKNIATRLKAYGVTSQGQK